MRGMLERCLGTFAACVLAGLYLAAGPGVAPAAAAAPAGWAPADLRAAYGLQSATSGLGITVAVVTAYDDPDAQSDLAVYRTQYGLPACASGCFSKVNQTGGTAYPAAGWSAQDAETLDAISAVCPNCRILLVEAASSAITDLGTAENEAVTLGAKFIANDWDIPEAEIGSTETSYDALYFNHPGVAITAPAGDSGYGVSYPAASPYVIAAGGTVLTQDTGTARGWDETAWAGSGSGCSAYEAKPAWQTDTGCSGRTDNDTAAVATNLAYYDTPATGGWSTGSGTAISAAITAAALALTGTPAPAGYPAAALYAHPANLNDITTGTNGTCSVTYLCTAAAGYDGPTGLGSPSRALNPTAVSTGATPVVHDPVTGNLEVYATSPNGNVEEDSYNKTSGWRGWQNLGGSITGTPFAIYDTTSGNFEVYATGTDGTLLEDYYVKSTSSWSGWFSHGGSLASSPSVVNDTFTGDLEVYATDSNGSLDEQWYNKSTGWHGQIHGAAGSITGTPSAVVDTVTGNLEVYATGTDGTLQEIYYHPADSTWSGFFGHGGSITGSPSAVVDTFTGNLEVYATGSNGSLDENWYNKSTGWHGQVHGAAGSITGSPSAVVDTVTSCLDVYATGTDGTLQEIFYNPGNSTWSGFFGHGGSITGSPAALVDTLTGNPEVYAVGTDGTLDEAFYNAGTKTWSGVFSHGGSIVAP